MSPSLHISQYLPRLRIGMGVPDTVAAVALLTCCFVTGCEAFGLYPYPSLFGFVPPPLAPRNPSPRNTTPRPPPVTPDANLPRKTPVAKTPRMTPDANPPQNTPAANPPQNPPNANTPANIPDANTPQHKPGANPPRGVISSSPNGGSIYPFYGRGTQRTFFPFPGRSGWGGFVNRYKPPPPPPESPGFQYTPSVPPDTAQDAQDFEEPHREWVYHYRGTRTKPYPERMSIAGHDNAVSRNTIVNLVPVSETVITGQLESRRDEAKHYPLTPMISDPTSTLTPSEVHSVSDPSAHTGTSVLLDERQYVTYPEQAHIQRSTKFIDGETNLPTSGGKPAPGGKPVFRNTSAGDTGQDALHSELFLMEGRSPSLHPVAEAYPVQEEQDGDWAAVAPFTGSNQPFLIANSLLSFFGTRQDTLKTN